MDLQERLGAAGQVLDVAIAAMFGPTGYRARAFLSYLLFDGACRRSGVDVLRLRGLGDDALELSRADELGLAAVPLGEDFSAGGTAKDAGVDEAWETDTWYVSAGAEYALEVPDGFGARTGRAWLVDLC